MPLYPGRARKLPAAERERRRRAGEPYALRLAMDAAVARAGVLTWTETGSGPQGQTGVVAAAPQMWGDVVLARKEVPASYHLAVALDDALQGVTDVVRGQDLFWATGIHRLLQALLGLPEPAYHHHKLIRRCRRPQAVEIDASDEFARTAGRRRNRRRMSGAWSALQAEELDVEFISFLPPPWHAARGCHGKAEDRRE